jgi:CBS domain-containing protein
MNVENWMSEAVVTCRPEDDLGEAARKMWENDCGALPVVDEDGRVVAMLTDRDVLMGTLHGGARLHELQVRDSMSRRVFTCRAADPIEDVMRLVGDQRIRRVPVVDREGRAIGVVSLCDLVRGLVALLEVEERRRLSSRLVEALACLSEPWHAGNEALDLPASAPRSARERGAPARELGRRSTRVRDQRGQADAAREVAQHGQAAR